jgi:hypothetical protein
LTGKKFGKLTAIKIVGRSNAGKMIWLCECECGNQTKVVSNSLVSGKTKSCGCSRYGNNKKYGSVPSHKQRLYNIWCGIKDRCFNSNNKSYFRYGGRGITMCSDWINNYTAFRDWAINNGYRKELTIDRIDVNGDYTPDNCRWADCIKQANNRTNSHYLTYKGRTMTISEWARDLGVNEHLIRMRIWKGWEVGIALTTPARRIKCHKK